jgi:hypothetical protein
VFRSLSLLSQCNTFLPVPSFRARLGIETQRGAWDFFSKVFASFFVFLFSFHFFCIDRGADKKKKRTKKKKTRAGGRGLSTDGSFSVVSSWFSLKQITVVRHRLGGSVYLGFWRLLGRHCEPAERILKKKKKFFF